jgi:hypothetical protein
MQRRSSARLAALVRYACTLGRLFWLNLAFGQNYLTPSDVVLPPEKASQEVLDQSAGGSSLRFAGLDLFPHVAVTAMYDDNLFISHTNPVSDLEWTFSPGLTVVAGDVSTYLPGSLTLAQVRDLLDYSLVDDSAKPRRFVGVDYTPSMNVFTEHSVNNNVDQRAGFSAGYAFSRLALGLDQDYSRVAEKDNQVGTRVTQVLYETRLRTRYEITDRSNLEVNGKYDLLEYDPPTYQGFQEFRNENWFNRQVGGKADAGLGLVLGFAFPDAQANQTYQQLLLRGVYRLTGKLDLRLSAGAEYRQYQSGRSDTLDPVVSVAGIYQASENTTFTLDVHRLDSPSPFGDYNYVTLGVYAGVQQKVAGRWSVGLAGGYDHIDYVSLQSGASNNRSDGYFSLQANVDYEMNRHLKARLFYNRRQDDSSLQTFSYANNMVGLQVAWRF